MPHPSLPRALLPLALLALAACPPRTITPIPTDAANDAAMDGAGGDGATEPDAARDGGGLDVPSPPPDGAPVDASRDVTNPPPDGAISEINRLDLLLEVDNSNSMRENQANIMAQLGPLVRALANPPCVNPANMTPHACDPMNPADRRVYPPVRDLHVGVISSDLGTAGHAIPGCANPTSGDDGRLNPIRYGLALRDHLPWAPNRGEPAPPGFRPADCTSMDQFPAFIRFDSATTNPERFEHDFRCNAGLYVNGCGLEQQLEAVYRALVTHDARARAGNTAPNAGFLREDAVLAILLLTDEEDMSVRDCRYAEPGVPCTDASDVFNAGSTRWASSNLNLRGYLYQPGGAQDPTWPLERYVDPRNPTRGLLGLKPGHPERIVFAAITGVPLQLPRRTDGTTNWDVLLGAPDARDPDNYALRNGRTALAAMSAEGPISMQQANQDPRCPERVVPACRREGSTYNATMPQCTTTEQYFAWPARRIVEVARRFDESNLCSGRPCRNGLVRSICGSNYAPIVTELVTRIGTRLAPVP